MSTKHILRLLLIVGTVGAASGLVVYSALGVKHQVGSVQVGEATFTKLTHEGFIVRGADGKFAVLDGYVIKNGDAEWVGTSSLMSTPASYGAGQMIAAKTTSTVKKPAPKVTAPKAPAPKKPAAKKPAPKKPACPT